MIQFVWSIEVDEHLGGFSRGILQTEKQPWPLDERVNWVHEIYRDDADAMKRLLELSRDGRDVYLTEER